MSLPTSAEVVVNWWPVGSRPAPEAQANRITAYSAFTTATVGLAVIDTTLKVLTPLPKTGNIRGNAARRQNPE